MTPEQMEWSRTRDELVVVIRDLRFPEELGSEIAKMLGSPKAMRRMISCLYYVKPKTAEIVVDEALAIASEIAAWKEKKASEERMVKRPVDVLRARIGALSAPVPRIQ